MFHPFVEAHLCTVRSTEKKTSAKITIRAVSSSFYIYARVKCDHALHQHEHIYAIIDWWNLESECLKHSPPPLSLLFRLKLRFYRVVSSTGPFSLPRRKRPAAAAALFLADWRRTLLEWFSMTTRCSWFYVAAAACCGVWFWRHTSFAVSFIWLAGSFVESEARILMVEKVICFGGCSGGEFGLAVCRMKSVEGGLGYSKSKTSGWVGSQSVQRLQVRLDDFWNFFARISDLPSFL